MGQTEHVKDNESPDFQTPILLQYAPLVTSLHIPLQIAVFHSSNADGSFDASNMMGYVLLRLSELVSEKGPQTRPMTQVRMHVLHTLLGGCV